jgi:ABC-2 type transport system ATP-binding protein
VGGRSRAASGTATVQRGLTRRGPVPAAHWPSVGRRRPFVGIGSVPSPALHYRPGMLRAENLTKRYDSHTALEGLTLTVQRGEVFCLLGANGAGKTTTINLFLNFIQPTSGTASINGLDVVREPLATKKFLAYIPETVMLYGNLTGLENLEYFSALAGRADYTRERLLGFCTRVGLQHDVADRRVGTYSKGMRQKVGIAIALAKGAKALLLDEPTSGLDPKASNEFSALLKQMSDEGVAVLMATHDLFRAKESGTRVGIMKHGRLVRTLATDEVGHADLERIYLEHMHD